MIVDFMCAPGSALPADWSPAQRVTLPGKRAAGDVLAKLVWDARAPNERVYAIRCAETDDWAYGVVVRGPTSVDIVGRSLAAAAYDYRAGLKRFLHDRKAWAS